MAVMPTSVYRARFRIAFLVLIPVHVYHNKNVTLDILVTFHILAQDTRCSIILTVVRPIAERKQ